MKGKTTAERYQSFPIGHDFTAAEAAAEWQVTIGAAQQWLNIRFRSWRKTVDRNLVRGVYVYHFTYRAKRYGSRDLACWCHLRAKQIRDKERAQCGAE